MHRQGGSGPQGSPPSPLSSSCVKADAIQEVPMHDDHLVIVEEEGKGHCEGGTGPQRGYGWYTHPY